MIGGSQCPQLELSLSVPIISIHPGFNSSMIITSLVIPKIESNYFVKLVLNDLIKAEGNQKKNDQDKVKTIRNYIIKIKEHYKKQL